MHVQSKPTLTKAGLAVGALGAAAVVLFNEVEIVLEVLGVAAAGNFLAKKLLFAKDREQTVEQIRSALTPLPHLPITVLSFCICHVLIAHSCSMQTRCTILPDTHATSPCHSVELLTAMYAMHILAARKHDAQSALHPNHICQSLC